jgi:hypothetical protein
MAGRKRKPMAGVVQGMDAFFSGPADQPQEVVEVEEKAEADKLARVTLYIRPDQDSLLTELQSKLKRKRVKTNRSELVQAAIDVLSKHDLESLEKIVHEIQKR